jgi:PTS system mannose-specific IID component
MDAVTAPAPTLTRGDLRSVFYRSFCLQSMWNFQRMQNVGWLFALWPVLRRLYPDKERRRAVALEHLEYFNTHPYFAGLILGVAAGLEEDHASGGPVRRDQIHAARKFMSGPLAALGDTVFWAAARPLAGVLAVAIGAVFPDHTHAFVPVVFLLVYNIPHLAVRSAGLWAGYALRAQVVTFLVRINPQDWVRGAYWTGAALSLAALALLWARFGPGREAVFVLLAAALILLRLGVSSTQLLYAAAGAAAAAGWAGVGR